MTKIEWADEIWSPIIDVDTLDEDCLEKPLRWRKPRRVLVGELFDPDTPSDFVDRVFAVMALAPQHTFMVLTKLPERMRTYLADQDKAEKIYPLAEKITGTREWADAAEAGRRRVGWPLPNVWLGVTVADQPAADERIPHLLATPAAKRFVIYEPARVRRSVRGRVDLTRVSRTTPRWTYFDNALTGFRATKMGGSYGPKLDWVIAGGEIGPNARPAHPDWFRDIRDQCEAAGVPFMFKHHGEWVGGTGEKGLFVNLVNGDERVWSDKDCVAFGDGNVACRVGKRAAGRLLDGREHNEFPED